jgi:hypothetical protein
MEQISKVVATKKVVGKKRRKEAARETIGIDLGDKVSRYAILDAAGEVVKVWGSPPDRPSRKQAVTIENWCTAALDVDDDFIPGLDGWCLYGRALAMSFHVIPPIAGQALKGYCARLY